jgi:hypothetical protein
MTSELFALAPEHGGYVNDFEDFDFWDFGFPLFLIRPLCCISEFPPTPVPIGSISPSRSRHHL